MAEIHSALLSFLRGASTRDDLAKAVEGGDAGAARQAAKSSPDDAAAVAAALAWSALEGQGPPALADAAKVFAQRASKEDAGNDVALLAGEVVWVATEQARLAEPYFRRVRRGAPDDPRVLAFYRELFSAEADASQLMQVLTQARRAAKDADVRFSLALEMASLAEERLGSIDRAVEVWRSALREGDEPRAVEQLRRLYRAGSKWTALVELLKEEFDRLPDSDAPDARALRIAKLGEIAELYRNELRLDAMALTTLQRILDIDPHHAASLAALADTYARSGRYNDLLGIYTRLEANAADAGDVAARVDALRKIAGLWNERLGNPQRAIEPLQQILALTPGDSEARGAIAKIHEARRDWRSLIALRREELAERTGDDAMEVRIELARLTEEKLGDRREAIADWNAVLEHHGDVDVALNALARLYEREARWAELAEVLHRQLAGTDDPQKAVRLLTTLGGIYVEKLRQPDAAIGVWREVLRLLPGHDKATRTLRDFYVQRGDWDDLTEMYRGQDRVAVLVETLQGAADRVQELDQRVELYRRVAHLCRTELGQPERALKALERTLAIQPDNLGVARELLPIYREQGNWARLMSTLEVLLGAATDVAEKLDLVASLRKVAKESLNSPALTFQWSARAFSILPSDDNLRAQLEEAAEASDAWDELTAHFEDRIVTPGVDEGERLILLQKLAVIARDKLFKPDDAQRYFRRIVDIDPANGDAMAALEQIYTSTRRWDDLAGVLRKRLEVENDTERRMTTLRALARLQQDQLGDLDGAIATYRAILELTPGDGAAMDTLADIYRKRGEWEPLVEVLGTKLGYVGAGAVRVPLLLELGRLRATRLALHEQATSDLLEVMELDPGNAAAVETLEGVRRAEPSLALRIAKGLLPYFRRIDDRAREAEAMEVVLAQSTEAGTPARTEQMRQLAAIYGRMPDRKPDALRMYGGLFVDHPTDWETRNTMHRLGKELGQIDALVARYEEVLAAIAERVSQAEQRGQAIDRAETQLRRDLLLELAAIQRDDLGRGGAAEALYAQVLELDETHQAAYEALEALLKARGASRELFALYRRRVDVVFNPREQRDLLARMIDLARNVLSDRDVAIKTAEELLDLVPDDIPTIKLLAEMYDRGDTRRDREALEELLGRWGELTDDGPRRHGLACRRASIRIQDLGDAFGAVDLLGAIVAEAPEHPEARALLEELVDIAEVQVAVVSLLEPIYVRLGDHRGRVRMLHVRRRLAEQRGDVDEATGLLLEVARVEETEFKDAATAFDVVRDAYLIDPRRLDALAQVERLGGELGRWDDLVATLRRALEHPASLDDRTLRIDLVRRVAALLDDKLQDAEGARDAYSELLALDPSDADIAHKTVAALCRLHLEQGDFIALVSTQRALLRFTDNPAEHVRVRLEIARYQLDYLLDRVGVAITLSEVLDLEPTNAKALDALEHLFKEEEEWALLCDVLVHRISVTSDARAAAAYWRRVGDIRGTRLTDRQGAISAFQSVLDLKVGREDSVYALQQLVAIHRALDNWPDVEDCLRRLTALTERDSERVQLLDETAEVVGTRLGRASDALELLKRVLDLAPMDKTARAMVTGYLEGDETRDRAVRILTPLYEAEQNWSGLLELQELQARKQPSGRRRLQALLKVAATMEERLQDPDRAFIVLAEALTEAGDQPELVEILDKVERLGAAAQRGEQLLAAYQRTVDHILDADLQKRVLRAIGAIALDRLNELDAARAAYARILETSPDDADALSAIERIYLRMGDHRAIAELLERRAGRVDDVGERDRLLVRAADLHRSQLEDVEQALALYERLSSDAIDRPEVQAVMEPLYESTGRIRELVALLGRKLGRLHGKARVETHMRLGRLYGEQLGEVDEGVQHLSAALRLDPDHTVGNDEIDRYLADPNMRVRVAEVLEPVFTAIQDWRRLVRVQEIRLAEAPSEEARVPILQRIAQLEEEQLEDLDRAFESYARLLALQPGNRYVRDQLWRLAGVLAAQERLAAILAAQSESTSDSDVALQLARDAADLLASSVLGAWSRAAPLYKRILAASPEDTEVFQKLEHALTRAEAWEELVEAYWADIGSSLDESRQADMLVRLANVAVDALGNHAEAARALAQLLEIRPDNEWAREQHERALEHAERWPELLDALRERLVRATAIEERSAWSLRIAELQRGRLGDAEGALETLRALLEERANDPAAIAFLEDLGANDERVREAVIDTLEPIYETIGAFDRSIEASEWRLSRERDASARHALYVRIADLHARARHPEAQSFKTFARALGEPGSDADLAELDERIGAAVAAGAATAAVYARTLVQAAEGEGLANEGPRRLVLLVRAAGQWLEGGDATAATETATAALAIDPSDHGALELLDRGLQTLGHASALAEVLARRVDVSDDDAQRVQLLRRLALLLEDVIGDAERARAVWERLVAIEPGDAEALSRLARAFEASGSTEDLVRVLEQRIESTSDAGERRDLRRRLALVLRERAGDRAGEADVLSALLSEAPDDMGALTDLSAALIALERWREAVEVLGERASRSEGSARADVLVTAGRLYGGKLEDPGAAIERFEQALSILPHQGAITELVRLADHAEASETAAAIVRPVLEQLEAWPLLAEVLRGRAKHAPDSEEAAAALRDLAALTFERLGDSAGALAVTLELVDLAAPADLGPVLFAAQRLADEIGQSGSVVEAFATRAAQTERDLEARLLLALAASETAQTALGDAATALDILLALLEERVADVRVCVRIQELATQLERIDVLGRAIAEHLELARGTDDAPVLLIRLGEVHVLLGRFAEAVDALTDAYESTAREDQAELRAMAVRGLEIVLERSPSPLAANLDALEQAYGDAQRADGLARVASVRLQLAAPGERAELLRSLARHVDAGGAGPADALEAWGSLVALEPEATDALERVLQLAGDPGLAPRAADLLELAFQQAKDARRTSGQVALAAARLLLDAAGSPARARVVLSSALDDSPDSSELLALWVESARRGGDPRALHDALTRAAGATVDPISGASAWEEAALLAEQLSDIKGAIADWLQVVDLQESHAGAWPALIRLLDQDGDHARLAEVLERRITTCDEDERRALRLQLARLLAGPLSRPDDAATVYRDMIGFDPGDAQALDELEALFRGQAAWSDVRETLERKLEAAAPDGRVALLIEIAKVAEHRLEDASEAIETYKRILLEAPAHAQAQVELERLLTAEERWPDLANLLEERMSAARAAGDVDGVRRVGPPLAEMLAKQLGDDERAQAILSEILDVDPTFVPAILALAEVYEARGDEGAMRLTLQRAAALSPSGTAGAALELKLAALSTDPQVRDGHLERALQLDPSNVAVAERLLSSSREAGRWDRVAELLGVAASQAPTPERARALELERIDVLSERVGDHDAALAVLAAIYETTKEDVEINRRIADALFASGSFDEAGQMYDWLFDTVEQANRRDKSLAHYGARLGRVLLQAGDEAGALGRLEAAFKIDSTRVETMIWLGQLYERAQRWGDALKIYRTMLLQNADQSGLLRRGDIYERLAAAHVGLGEKPKAQAMLRRGMEEDPSHPQLSAALANLN